VLAANDPLITQASRKACLCHPLAVPSTSTQQLHAANLTHEFFRCNSRPFSPVPDTRVDAQPCLHARHQDDAPSFRLCLFICGKQESARRLSPSVIISKRMLLLAIVPQTARRAPRSPP
jgi:hypothetical protein